MSGRHHRAPWQEKRAPKRKSRRNSYYAHRKLRPGLTLETVIPEPFCEPERVDGFDEAMAVLDHQARLYWIDPDDD